MYESQDTGITVSRGNSHDGQSSRGRCSGLARCAEGTATGKNDQDERDERARFASVKVRTSTFKTPMESVAPISKDLADAPRKRRGLLVDVVQQVVVGDHSVASLGQHSQGHIEIIHGHGNRTLAVSAVDQRVRVVDVDFRLKE